MWPIYVVTAELVIITLFALSSVYESHKKINEVDVVIIGAGPSGIAAATRLLEHGFNNIRILEAENRIGGRMNTVKLDDGIIEMGCQWVHGEKANVVYRMASEQKLLMNGLVGEGIGRIFVDESGQLIDSNVAEKYTNILDKITESLPIVLKNCNGSVGEYFDQEYPKRLKENSLRESNLSKQFLNLHHKSQNSMDASDSWYETSGHGQSEYHESEGKNWVWKSGYSAILDVLMKKIPNPSEELPVRSKTNLNSEVTNIIWDNLPGEKANQIMVECSDRSKYIAKHVILTVSLGVLKDKFKTMFHPELNTKKLTAIKGLNIGTVDKIFLKFPYKWWPDNYREFYFLWNEPHPCREKECWMKDIILFHVVDNQPLVLCGWITGPAARYMEKLPINDVLRESVKLLKRFFGNTLNITIPEPVLILRSTWFSNPHFLGSYTFRSMETEALGTSAAHLAEPVTNKNGLPVLLFAGEATNSHHFSTVHGAIETGWREADRILEIYHSQNSSL